MLSLILQYATESWLIARKMQAIWGKEFLAKCVGLDAIWARAPFAEIYNQEVSKEQRAAITEVLPVAGQQAGRSR